MTDPSATFTDKLGSIADRDEFVCVFGSIYEHSPWVAEQVWDQNEAIVTTGIDTLQLSMRDVVERATLDQKLTLIRQHPDLADPAAKAGKLSDMSNREQLGAGLTDTTQQETARFAELNRAYKDKFGFPFVIAVKGLGRVQILEAFEDRLSNNRDQELETALAQIHKIAAFRLASIVETDAALSSGKKT